MPEKKERVVENFIGSLMVKISLIIEGGLDEIMLEDIKVEKLD